LGQLKKQAAALHEGADYALQPCTDRATALCKGHNGLTSLARHLKVGDVHAHAPIQPRPQRHQQR
jgi:hypothetical protein